MERYKDREVVYKSMKYLQRGKWIEVTGIPYIFYEEVHMLAMDGQVALRVAELFDVAYYSGLDVIEYTKVEGK